MDVDKEDRDNFGLLGGGAPPTAINSANAGAIGQGSSAGSVGDAAAVRRFLREIGGVPEGIIKNGTWVRFVG